MADGLGRPALGGDQLEGRLEAPVHEPEVLMSGGEVEQDPSGLSVDAASRALLLLTPRLVGRAKRLPVPVELQSYDLAPRHLSLLAYLLSSTGR